MAKRKRKASLPPKLLKAPQLERVAVKAELWGHGRGSEPQRSIMSVDK